MVLVPALARKYQISGAGWLRSTLMRATRLVLNCQAASLAYFIEMQPEHKPIWHSPEEIVEVAFQRARVVMMNEAHSGLQRCIRTRQTGQQILPVAHQGGVRHLAMEALRPAFAEEGNRTRIVPESPAGYLSQPEMRSFVQAALHLGWSLVPYEANPFPWLSARYGREFPDTMDGHEIGTHLQHYQTDLLSQEYTNWREEQQALNLIKALESLPANTPLLVWCGNNHHSKKPMDGWLPMGYQFQQHSGVDPFVINQTLTVKFDPTDDFFETELISPFSEELAKFGGTAGLLLEELPSSFARFGFEDLGDNAILISTQNDLE